MSAMDVEIGMCAPTSYVLSLLPEAWVPMEKISDFCPVDWIMHQWQGG